MVPEGSERSTHPGAAADESAAERQGASVGPEGPERSTHPGAAADESAAERQRASVGPEGRTERSNYSRIMIKPIIGCSGAGWISTSRTGAGGSVRQNPPALIASPRSS